MGDRELSATCRGAEHEDDAKPTTGAAIARVTGRDPGR